MVQFTPREQMYIDLIRYYGLRKEEALALKKSDFDFDSQILKVEHAVKFISNRPTEKETKTGKNRYLMMFPYHIEQFMAFLLCCDDEDPHIFRNLQDGKWITQQSFRRMYAAIMNKLKNRFRLLYVKPHPWRIQSPQFPNPRILNKVKNRFRALLVQAQIRKKKNRKKKMK